jgi:UDPglucose 6-dehydrogenase
MQPMKKITVIGTGYVGLVTGTCFAELGNDVTCVDIDEKKVAMMNQGRMPIYEPGLENMFQRNQREGRIRVTTDLAAAMKQASVVFLALPTPMGEDGSADLSYIFGVSDVLGPLLPGYTVIIDKSTVPVGTAEQVHQRIAAHTTAEFDVVSNPEFLREGLALQDFMQPDRIVIGTSSEKGRTVMAELYEPITRNDHPIYFMSERSAEMAKYAANSFLAVKITFMNQIANLCERTGADADDVRIGVGSDSRIGQKFLYPGIGYGGSCFPKDVQALIRTAEDNGYNFQLLKTVIENNQAQKKVLTAKVLDYFNGNVAGKTFAMWGLAFKPETDDIREAPSIEMIKSLIAAGATIRAYDPEAMGNIHTLLGDTPGLELVDDEYTALDKADALLIVTEWPQFAAASKERIKSLLSQPVIFDGRNMFKPADMQAAGFHYQSIGRPSVSR